MDNQIVTLIIPGEKYKYLKTVLREHKDFIYSLGVHDLIKERFVKDTQIIRTILETGERK